MAQVTEYSDLYEMAGWLDFNWLLANHRAVYDALDHRVDRVRAVKVVDGGVHVRVLATVDGGQLAVVGGNEAREFEAFVPGGYVGKGNEQKP